MHHLNGGPSPIVDNLQCSVEKLWKNRRFVQKQLLKPFFSANCYQGVRLQSLFTALSPLRNESKDTFCMMSNKCGELS